MTFEHQPYFLNETFAKTFHLSHHMLINICQEELWAQVREKMFGFEQMGNFINMGRLCDSQSCQQFSVFKNVCAIV